MKSFGFAILGVLALASLFGCRASKNATEESKVVSEVKSTEQVDFNSAWERFIKNHINITLDGIEIELPTPCVDSPLDSVPADIGSPLYANNAVPTKTANEIAQGQIRATTPTKIKIGKAVISSTTEQEERQAEETTASVVREEQTQQETHKTEQVKNQTAETITALKIVGILVVLIFVLDIVFRWLKKRGKI